MMERRDLFGFSVEVDAGTTRDWYAESVRLFPDGIGEEDEIDGDVFMIHSDNHSRTVGS